MCDLVLNSLSHHRTDFFEKLGPHYDLLLDLLTFGNYGKFLRKAVQVFGPQKGDKILDLCSGTGRVASWMSEMIGEEGEVMGMDITPGMIHVARERYGRLANVSFLRKDVTQPWEYQDHFDGIFMSFALHELPEKYRAGVLERSYSALKKKGRMVIADFDPRPSGRAKFFSLIFFKLFEKQNLSFFSFPQNEILSRIGFRIVRTFPVFSGIFQITLARKI